MTKVIKIKSIRAKKIILHTVYNTQKNNLYQNMKLYDDKKGEIMI